MSGAERVAFETARLRLVEIRGEGRQALDQAYRAACRQSSQTLDVDRVSIWFLSPRRDSIECALQYDRRTDGFETGGRIERTGCKRYFDAIESRRVVVAEDAFKDPKTDQLESYLERAGVGALLDAPIYRDGHVTGVVCHEHVGGPREWQEREASFASTVADLLTMLIQQAERAELRAALDVRRELEAENRKMDALLRMARVVVHDLGNVLTVAAMRAEDIDARAEELGGEKVSEVLDYGVKLLEQLRDFCDRVEPESVAFAAEVLRALESTLRNLLGTSIRLDFQCKVPAGLRIAVSPVELEQLILNLCMNAKDAIGDAGTIVLSATTSAGSLFIEIRDSGCGMDDATQQHLFEPFYSTKDGHTGVGLSAVFGIVDRIGGLIHVQSARGHGSTFRVELPLLQAQPARRAV